MNASKSAVKNVFDEGRRGETFLVFRGTADGRSEAAFRVRSPVPDKRELGLESRN